MKKIGIIGQFPPPLHGLSKALDTLCRSYIGEKYNLVKFNISNNRKFLKRIFEIIKSNLDVYYLTISQSKFGNIRDLIIIRIIQYKKKKVVIHLHGGGFREILENDFGSFQKKMNYKILKNVELCIVLGDSLKYIFDGIIDQEKIKIVKNCVDNEFIISDYEFEEKMKILKEKEVYKILYLSNFIEEKGYKDVLRIAKYIKEKGDKRFKFLFAGKFFNDNEKKYFFSYIKDNSLEEFVDYKGIVYGDEKKNLLKESDYFILLTRYKKEGQPISIIEAASDGLDIITTNHAGISDILTEDEMMVCDKNNINIEDIYFYLNKASKEEVVNRIRKNRKKVLNDFSEKNYLESLDYIFKEI